jgi:glycerophosphodiester phosphodiesterase
LRRLLDRLVIVNTALDSKKLQWFLEINTRAVRRILAKLARHGQAENPSYQGLQARWQTLHSTWKGQLDSASQTTIATLPLAENAVLSRISRAAADKTILLTDDDGFTPLHLAVIGNHTQAALDMIDSLLHADGVAPTAAVIMSDVLAIALRTQNDDIVRCLSSAGHACLCRPSGRGETALHVAVQMGRLDYVTLIVQVMREQGAIFDVPDNSRAWTPLFFACADGNADIARLLIEAGSSQGQQDRLGWTAKEVAAYRGHLAVADLFEASSGVDVLTPGGPANPLPHAKVSASRVRCGHDQSVVIATWGTTSSDRPVAGVNLSFCSSAYTPGNYEAASFVLEVSAPGVSERRRVPLPILEDQINDPFVFVVPSAVGLRLRFDVIRLTGSPGKEMLAASGTALLAGDHRQFGTDRQSLVREQTVSILETDTMRMAGVVTFTPLVVRPFSHLQSPRLPDGLVGNSSATPLLVGHRGAGQNVKTRRHLQVGENTVASFLSATRLGASFVEFDVQVTRDLQAVAFHDFSLSESGTDVPIHDVTLDQFLHASNVQSPRGNPPAVLGTAHSREEPGRSRSRSLGRQFEAGAVQVRDRLKHTVDFQNKGFKPNTRGDFVQDSFATLQEILLKLPQDIGCDIEISSSPWIISLFSFA